MLNPGTEGTTVQQQASYLAPMHSKPPPPLSPGTAIIYTAKLCTKLRNLPSDLESQLSNIPDHTIHFFLVTVVGLWRQTQYLGKQGM